DMHHIISDGVSMSLLQEDFTKLLSKQELEPLKLQYKDYSEWQNSEEHLIEVKEQEEYWKNEYCDEIPVLSLPYDYPRPVEQSYNGASVELILDKELTDKIQTLCREANTTLYITFLSLFNIWLSKLSGQEDIVVGIPVAGREHPDLSCVIGMFVNTLAFRNYPKRELTYKEFFEEIKNRASEAFDNQLYQFEDLVENLDIVRDIGRNPIFDVSLNLLETEEYLREQVTNQELEHIKGVAKFDLSLDILHNNKDICLTFNYCTKLFKTDTIDRFVIYFKNLIERITLEIKLRDIDIISEEEKHLLLHNFNNTKAEYPKDKTIHQLFEEQVERTPDQTALIFEGQAMSYRDLNRKSNQLARSLRNKGVEPDTIVGIMGDRTFETIVGILGILKSGGAYLPIDPDYPEARINCMLEDAEVKILLTQNKYLQTFSNYNDLNIIDIEYKTIFIGEDTNLDLINRSSDLAYVIYTSGSTGKPKGVMIEHRSLVNLCNWHNSSFDVTENDNATLYAGFRFDASVWELFPYLAKGVSLHIISGDIRLDVGMLNKYYQQNNITISFLPTQVCEQFMSLHNNSLRYLLTGADKLKHFANTNYKVVNNYGPTENTVVTSFFIVDKFYNNIPIGKPIHNTQIYILDRFNNLQPEGVSGELCIGGEGLARGYLNNSTLTSEKFIKN
ncbi:MAG: AMP-binding protein, partial [Candidatus Delongbacteria bacterium]|nr:AMP-binding protein [Candidatus Delongbacteria bacterium]